MPADQEQDRVELHAALLENDVERLYEHAPCGYLSTSPDGTIVRVNETFLTWTGYTREELLGRRFSELLTAGGRIYHATHYAPMLLMHDAVREIALDARRANGEVLPLLLNASLERDAAGDPAVVRVAMFDATDRREYERELLRAKERAEASEAHAVRLARTLQQTLVPPKPPVVPGLDVATAYRPAGDGREVGGDYYDVFQLSEDEWAVVLGDVSGKGVEAAVITSLIRYSLRAITVMVSDPSQALEELNDIVLSDETERFSTLVLMRLRRAAHGWKLTASSAGHAPALLRRATGEVETLGEPGFLVGAFEDAEYTTTGVALGPGDTVLLYTDGVTEARRGDEFYGEERLWDCIAEHGADPRALATCVLDEVLTFQGGDTRDDVAVVALRVPDGGGTAPRS